eukprot:6044432-Pleurochrysis_carterae.AAC.2
MFRQAPRRRRRPRSCFKQQRLSKGQPPTDKSAKCANRSRAPRFTRRLAGAPLLLVALASAHHGHAAAKQPA